MNNYPSSDMYVISYKNQLIFTLIFIKVPTLYSETEGYKKNSYTTCPTKAGFTLHYTLFTTKHAQMMEPDYRRKFGRPTYRQAGMLDP